MAAHLPILNVATAGREHNTLYVVRNMASLRSRCKLPHFVGALRERRLYGEARARGCAFVSIKCAGGGKVVVRTASTNANLDALQSRTRQAELFVLVLWAVGAGGWLPLLEVVCQVANKSELFFQGCLLRTQLVRNMGFLTL